MRPTWHADGMESKFLELTEALKISLLTSFYKWEKSDPHRLNDRSKSTQAHC